MVTHHHKDGHQPSKTWNLTLAEPSLLSIILFIPGDKGSHKISKIQYVYSLKKAFSNKDRTNIFVWYGDGDYESGGNGDGGGGGGVVVGVVENCI